MPKRGTLLGSGSLPQNHMADRRSTRGYEKHTATSSKAEYYLGGKLSEKLDHYKYKPVFKYCDLKNIKLLNLLTQKIIQYFFTVSLI